MDEDVMADKMAKMIYERTQMTQGDAEDLAWDLLALIGD